MGTSVIFKKRQPTHVYFMNLVDEADLMALIEREDGAAAPTCSCTEKCVVGDINTNCEICRSNMSECVGKEPVVEPDPTEPTEEPDEEKKGANPLPILILIVALGAGGAVYWFKFRKEDAAWSCQLHRSQTLCQCPFSLQRRAAQGRQRTSQESRNCPSRKACKVPN